MILSITNNNHLLQSSHKQHLMLLYDDEAERSLAEIDCIDYALNEGQYYCIYATVDANDEDFVSEKIIPKIKDYSRHIQEGNFVIINFKPFYDSAANGDLTPFKQLKAQVEATLRNRIALGKNGRALLVADAACNLARNKQFNECVTLEEWWQETYEEWMAKKYDITIICAHPASVLKQQSMLEQKNNIAYVHSLMLDLNDFKGIKNREAYDYLLKPQLAAERTKCLRILVLEPDADTRLVYRRYLRSLPIELVTLDDGIEWLEKTIMVGNNNNRQQDYDLIIIDAQVKDNGGGGIHIAKEILKKKPYQQIIFTTTSDIHEIGSELESHLLETDNKYSILQKPFRFSQLLALIRPAAKPKMVNHQY